MKKTFEIEWNDGFGHYVIRTGSIKVALERLMGVESYVGADVKVREINEPEKPEIPVGSADDLKKWHSKLINCGYIEKQEKIIQRYILLVEKQQVMLEKIMNPSMVVEEFEGKVNAFPGCLGGTYSLIEDLTKQIRELKTKNGILYNQNLVLAEQLGTLQKDLIRWKI